MRIPSIIVEPLHGKVLADAIAEQPVSQPRQRHAPGVLLESRLEGKPPITASGATVRRADNSSGWTATQRRGWTAHGDRGLRSCGTLRSISVTSWCECEEGPGHPSLTGNERARTAACIPVCTVTLARSHYSHCS